MAREDTKGKQEIRLRFEFIDHNDESKSQVNEHVWIDTPDVIGLIQAGAVMPGFIVMNQNFLQMAKAKALNNTTDSDLANFLSSL